MPVTWQVIGYVVAGSATPDLTATVVTTAAHQTIFCVVVVQTEVV